MARLSQPDLGHTAPLFCPKPGHSSQRPSLNVAGEVPHGTHVFVLSTCSPCQLVARLWFKTRIEKKSSPETICYVKFLSPGSHQKLPSRFLGLHPHCLAPAVGPGCSPAAGSGAELAGMLSPLGSPELKFSICGKFHISNFILFNSEKYIRYEKFSLDWKFPLPHMSRGKRSVFPADW